MGCALLIEGSVFRHIGFTFFKIKNWFDKNKKICFSQGLRRVFKLFLNIRML